jgi:hypothetical protein
MSESDKPKFEHDHDCCVFLGHWDGGQRPADLYYCDQGIGEDIVLARYSDEGSDYQSGLYGAEQIPELAAAKRLAEGAGLLPCA